MQVRQLQVDGLPPEIWQHVLEHLPKPDQRTCRLVCRVFHGLATGMVFARVVVSFGDWDIWNKFNSEMEIGLVVVNPEVEVERSLERSVKSLGILDHVVADAWLAGMVKSLEVHAFEVGAEPIGAPVTTSFMARLTAALRTLRQLRSFIWHGEDPMPSLEIVDALSTSCPFLHVLSLPMQSLRDLPLTTFRWLHTISVTSAEYITDHIEHKLSAGHCTTLLPYLHTLQLPYSVPTDIPISCLPNLTHLELVSMHSYVGLGAILRQVPRLQSLALFSPVHDQEHIFAELADAKADVPHLSALALQGPSPHVTVVDPAELTQLCDFLRGRKALRRMYFTFELATAGLDVYLETIATLKNMEIFDLRMENQPFDRAFLTGLTRYLPSSLSAMKLTSCGSLTDKDAFADFWTHFRELGFLYVRTWEGTSVSVQDVIRGAHKLDLVGFNGHFQDVQYIRIGDALWPLALPPWPPRKTALRGVEDFGCEGWEWLMRHLTIVP